METFRFALVGAPNCGKTVLFNALTGARAKVANYAGVTVDKREGIYTDDHNIYILDLPGTYSLRVTSPDEEVTRNVLLGKLDTPPDAIIAVADATNLHMTLRMILELKLLQIPMVVSLNLSDVARLRGLDVSTEKLSALLDVPVVETVAVTREGTQALRDAIKTLTKTHHNLFNYSCSETEQQITKLDSKQLYQQVGNILQQSINIPMTMPNWHKRLDRLLLHPASGIVILLLILFLVFQAVYAWSEPVMGAIEDLFKFFSAWLGEHMSNGLLKDLLIDGVIAGIGNVLVFLPQITILFAFILLLEDSGYLPRAAFLLDNVLAKTGLSGRAFIPLLSGFACAIPAIMATRTIQSSRERLVTIAITPLLTCSARLPIYTLIIAAVIPNKTVWHLFNMQGLTLFSLYLLAILSAAIAAIIMKLVARRQGNIQQFPLLMELPAFRMPNFKHIVLSLWDRISAFLKRAGTVIFSLSVVLWFLVSFPEAPQNATLPAIEYSFAGTLGSWIQPLFAPLGFTWQMCIAMIPGIAAREVVIASLGTVYAVSGADEAVQHNLMQIVELNWGLATAFSFLAWYVYAPMCIATLAVIKRETKSMTKTLLVTGYLFASAYLFAFLVYHLVTEFMA